MQHELLFLGASRDDHTNFRTNFGVVVEVMPRRITGSSQSSYTENLNLSLSSRAHFFLNQVSSARYCGTNTSNFLGHSVGTAKDSDCSAKVQKVLSF
jgi:hypothetical protein